MVLAMTADQVHDNLADAGCGAELIRQFDELVRTGNRRALRQLLDSHRQALLNDIHAGQKRLDCLDYLIYRMNEQGMMAR